MIVDVHRHMWSAGQRYRAAFAGLPAKYQRPETNFDGEEATQEAVEEMDGAGVDKSVLLVADFAARLGDAALSIEEENRLVVEATGGTLKGSYPITESTPDGRAPPTATRGPLRSGV